MADARSREKTLLLLKNQTAIRDTELARVKLRAMIGLQNVSTRGGNFRDDFRRLVGDLTRRAFIGNILQKGEALKTLSIVRPPEVYNSTRNCIKKTKKSTTDPCSRENTHLKRSSVGRFRGTFTAVSLCIASINFDFSHHRRASC